MVRESIREYLTPEERALPLESTIDPGFVHKRKIQTIIGADGMRIIDDLITKLPTLQDWEWKVRVDHIYNDLFLHFCRINGIFTLEKILAAGKGLLFCSTERLAPCNNIYDVERAISVWIPRGQYNRRVELHYSTAQVASDTLRGTLHRGDEISIVAELHSATDDLLVFHPIIMGSPWLRTKDPKWKDQVMWWGREFFEHYVEDFDEFSKVNGHEKPTDLAPMKNISERAFKRALCEILGDSPSTDWGGETSDHFTPHLHLNGRRVSAAFLLKGPAKFAPMGLNHLGKNNDQIYRLAQEPVEVLIVQHCHDIKPAVRATLRAFTVQPYGKRRYCLIDGRDSLWLLQSYDLYEKAIKWSREDR